MGYAHGMATERTQTPRLLHWPAALRERLAATAQWQTIALRAPQNTIEVRLAAGSQEIDVTAKHVIAALNPLTIAIGLDPGMRSALESRGVHELRFIDRDLGRPLGVLRLRPARIWSPAEMQIALFEVARGTQRCASWPRLAWDRWMYRRSARKRSAPDGLALSLETVEQTLIFYICPRPVFLVSVDDGRHSNLFPMDLVGPISPERFTLALRNTSPSIETIKKGRRAALSSVAAAEYETVYQLGAHHKKLAIDPASLPFELSRSQLYSLPVPASALRVREVEILDHKILESHTFFVGRIVSDEQFAEDPQLFHTCGAHQRLRTRRRLPFQTPAASGLKFR
jgi:flavin reductase (DIM6/NTAB) family NADH-FMN oxidoreductase RutF